MWYQALLRCCAHWLCDMAPARAGQLRVPGPSFKPAIKDLNRHSKEQNSVAKTLVMSALIVYLGEICIPASCRSMMVLPSACILGVDL